MSPASVCQYRRRCWSPWLGSKLSGQWPDRKSGQLRTSACRPGFHTTTQEPKRAHSRPSKTRPKLIQRKDTQRDTQRTKKFWAVRRSPNQPQQPQPQHTNTAQNGGWRPNQNKCGPEEWEPKGRAPSPRVKGLGVGLGFRSEVFGVLGFLGSEILAKTLKHKLAKVGLAKVDQHIKTLKLAQVGLAKVGHDPSLSPSAIPQTELRKLLHRSVHQHGERLSTFLRFQRG